MACRNGDESDFAVIMECGPQNERHSPRTVETLKSAEGSLNSRSRKSRYFLFGLGLVVFAASLILYRTRVFAHDITKAQLNLVESERQELQGKHENLLFKLIRNKKVSIPMEEEDDLVEHVKMLHQQLEVASKALEEERQNVITVKQQVDQAWEEVSLLTNELSKAEEQMQMDQSMFFRNLALQQFGAGPHFAEFQVKLWKGSESESMSFKVEFAPVDLMPVTVYLIMSQIERGLWDNTSFHINAPHVILARPISAMAEATNLKTMERLGLARLPFAEYSERFPHHAYTLGLGGRVLPGPNFFVNKMDNTDNHIGQPCFARVITGHHTIDELGKTTGLDPNDPYYIQPAEIRSVRLIS